MTQRDLEEYFNVLEAEFNSQRASTLTRFGKRLEAEAIKCADQLDNLDNSDKDALDRYRKACAAFLEARSAYIFQREMLGLLEHHRVDEIFPIPPRR